MEQRLDGQVLKVDRALPVDDGEGVDGERPGRGRQGGEQTGGGGEGRPKAGHAVGREKVVRFDVEGQVSDKLEGQVGCQLGADC